MYTSILPLLVLAPGAFAQLNTLAKAAGKKYFGTATDNGELGDTAYTAILDNTTEFGQLTPGNYQKWEFTEPEQGVFNYTNGDVVPNLAKKNGQLLRCHNLVWYEEIPSWVTQGTWTNATMQAALKAHITSEVTHYKGQCYAWDVVNEAFTDDGGWRSNPVYDAIGEEYIAIAFEAAAAADPDVKLYYNDYNIEFAGTKATLAQNLVKSLKARGIKIDGVGLESHFVVGETPSQATQLANMQAFIALGVEVAITELDVRFSSLPPTTAQLTQQATDYANSVGACVAAGASCVGITVWDFDDKYSWVPSTFSGEGEADLYNADLTKKPAYAAVVSVLEAGATTGKATATTATATAAKTTAATTAATTPTTVKTTAPVASSASSTTLATKTVATTVATAAASAVAKYGQCGGQAYTGSTTCASGSTCHSYGEWYSQCL